MISLATTAFSIYHACLIGMALSVKYMAKSNMAKQSHTLDRLRVEFLYSGKPTHVSGFRVPVHTHPFWQLEIIRIGRITATAENLEFDLRRGSFFLVAPGCSHGFHYRAPSSSVISCKLRVHGFAPQWPARAMAKEPNLTIMRTALSRALPDNNEPVHEDRYFIEDLLCAAIRLFMPGRSPANTGKAMTLLQEKVDDLIAANIGKPLTVHDTAAGLGYSTGYLSAQFRKATGQSIKTYLDRKRADFAARLLQYADLTIGQIAERMGFSDQFAFSRFFRRIKGICPREYRQIK